MARILSQDFTLPTYKVMVEVLLLNRKELIMSLIDDAKAKLDDAKAKVEEVVDDAKKQVEVAQQKAEGEADKQKGDTLKGEAKIQAANIKEKL